MTVLSMEDFTSIRGTEYSTFNKKADMFQSETNVLLWFKLLTYDIFIITITSRCQPKGSHGYK